MATQDQTTPAAPQMMGEFPLANIVANPQNPRTPEEESEDAIALKASIAAQGLLQPIAIARISDVPKIQEQVEGSSEYVVIGGNRRLAAMKSLGWETTPAIVIPLDHEGQVSEMILTENGQREGLHYLAEASQVRVLLDLPGATTASVARSLGRSPLWTARRAQLGNLCPEAREAVAPGGRISHWPVTWVEELAKVSATGQEELLQGSAWALRNIKSIEEVEQLVLDTVRPLRLAPWDLADEELVPAVGSCSDCPKQTGCQPTLWGLEPDKDARDQSACTDVRCWSAKMVAQAATLIGEAREKHGSQLLLRAGDLLPGAPQSEQGVCLPEGERLTPSYGLKPCKKSDEGARPVLTVMGKGAGGRVRWMRARNERTKLSGEKRRKTLAEKRAGLQVRREKWAIGHLVEALAGDGPTLLDFEANDPLRYAATWGVSLDWIDLAGGDRSPLWRLKDSNRTLLIGKKVVDAMLTILYSTKERHEHLVGEAKLICRALTEESGLTWKKALAEAGHEIPEPKSWAKQESEEMADAATEAASEADGEEPKS